MRTHAPITAVRRRMVQLNTCRGERLNHPPDRHGVAPQHLDSHAATDNDQCVTPHTNAQQHTGHQQDGNFQLNVTRLEQVNNSRLSILLQSQPRPNRLLEWSSICSLSLIALRFASCESSLFIVGATSVNTPHETITARSLGTRHPIRLRPQAIMEGDQGFLIDVPARYGVCILSRAMCTYIY